MLTLDYLKSLSPDEAFSDKAKYMQGVHALLFGEWQTFVTDGRGALFLRDAVEGATAVDPRVLEALKKVGDPCGLEHRVPLAELAAWLGEYIDAETCDECDGTGETHCSECDRDGATCPDCGGSGETGAPVRTGRIFNAAIDRNRLAKWLRHLPGDTVAVICDGDKPVNIIGDGWRVVVMPMQLGRWADAEAPEFRPTVETVKT